MKFWVIILLVFSIVSCGNPIQSPVESQADQPTLPERSSLPDLGKAPELQNEVWLNAEAPLRLQNLGGKVVLLEMWTFG